MVRFAGLAEAETATVVGVQQGVRKLSVPVLHSERSSSITTVPALNSSSGSKVGVSAASGSRKCLADSGAMVLRARMTGSPLLANAKYNEFEVCNAADMLEGEQTGGASKVMPWRFNQADRFLQGHVEGA